jgi:3-hydroxy acid dehydrogenase / malonic semialdehyde reductase
MNRLVLITGATSGIGKACAEKFASEGDNLIITGRRKERLDELKDRLESEFKIQVTSLNFDVRDKAAVFQQIGSLPATLTEIDILINNAGLALGRDSFDEADLEDWDTMIDTNLKGLLYVSKAVVPFMKARRSGHIINIGSVAGKEIYDKGNVYCATKFGVDAISRAMRIELLPHAIKVTAINPGAVYTEFSEVRFKGDKAKAESIYQGFQPLSAKDVADTISYVCSLPQHVCINDLVITCLQQGNAIYFHKDLQ